MFKLLSAFVIFAVVAAQDWCEFEHCRYPNTHVLCTHSEDFGEDCEDPSTVEFTAEEIQAILDTHNEWRHNAAAGILIGFLGEALPPATRMAKMQWSDQLAEFADINTRTCLLEHDGCRASYEFNFSGQNLASNVANSITSPINITYAVMNSINRWAKEHQFARVSDISRYTSSSGGNGQAIGHFTAVVNEKMTHVGCGMTLYTSGEWNRGILACNYAFNNIIDRRVYQAGPVASHCTSGRDSTFSNLCTINENINVNDITRFSETLEANFVNKN